MKVEEVRAAKRARFETAMIRIKVRDHTFKVHKDVIFEQSEYFRKAFNEQWAEGKTRKIEMVEDEPEVIGDYIDWLYGNEMTVEVNNKDDTEWVEDYVSQHEQLAKLYVFGEKVQDNRLCNDVVSAILTLVDQSLKREYCRAVSIIYPVLPRIVEIIYDGTPIGSPARRLFAELTLLIRQGGLSGPAPFDLEDYPVEDWPPEYLYDVAVAALDYAIRRQGFFHGSGGSSEDRKHWKLRAEWFKE